MAGSDRSNMKRPGNASHLEALKGRKEVAVGAAAAAEMGIPPTLCASHFDDVSRVELQVSNCERTPLCFS